jgi:thymidylate synthase
LHLIHEREVSMKQYLDLLENTIKTGVLKQDRTGTGTLSIFGYQTRYNLQEGFPLITTKKLHLKSIIHELLWFLSGETNIAYLQENGVKIWNEWANEAGEVGKIYGYQWRCWETVQREHSGHIRFASLDQIKILIDNLKKNPHSRRHIINAWNVGQLDEMSLPPCHLLSQFYVDDKNRLSLQLYQRSCDLFLGCPFNIASYSLLLMMIAQVCDLEPYEFIHTIGDAHLYLNHVEQAKTQLSRKPKKLPTMKLNPKIKNIDDFSIDDFTLEGYEAHPHIKGKVSV